MIGKLDDYLRFNEVALNLRAQRQQVLSSNIANADTPEYKARDIDFAAALQGAMGRANTAASALTVSAARHFPGAAANPAGTLPDGTPLLFRTPAQGAVDGNTVEMDVERSAFADNGIRYETGVTLINAQIKGMLTAIQGGQ
ncbi:MAG: flagellar basal body rod protein FlgB [Pseudomonadota bacterium]